MALVHTWLDQALALPFLFDTLSFPGFRELAPPQAYGLAGVICIPPQDQPVRKGWTGVGVRAVTETFDGSEWLRGSERVSIELVRRDRNLVAQWRPAPWPASATADDLATATQRAFLDWYAGVDAGSIDQRAKVAAWRPSLPVETLLWRLLGLLDEATKESGRVGRLVAADIDVALTGVTDWLGTQAPSDPDQVLIRRVRQLKLSDDVTQRVEQELDQLAQTRKESSEREKIVSFLQVIVDLPWSGEVEPPKHTLAEGRAALDREHAGMREAKQQILDQLAALLWWGKRQAAAPDEEIAPPSLRHILLVGPPGTGKTTILQSIGQALGRRSEIVACGGFSDISALTGFERGYIGARPGAIIDAVRRARTRTLLLGLDEIDKMGDTHRGDPFAVLMELTDPAQNARFVDRYLQVPFDMSRALVVATANEPERIPPALRDRFRIVEIRGYSPTEKLAMAHSHILPRIRLDLGVPADVLAIDDQTLGVIIEEYTFESGVRGLHDTLLSLFQRALPPMLDDDRPAAIDAGRVRILLGNRGKAELAPLTGAPGYGTALSVISSVGIGRLFGIEVSLIEGGTGALSVTGTVNDEIKETVSVALDLLRVRAQGLGFDPAITRTHDIHVHQDGIGVSKGGPSGGVASVLVLLSAFRGVSLRGGLAATGEVTLDGRVLRVGGIPEKVIAAHRSGARTVLLPAGNQPDLEEIPADVRSEVELILVSRIEDAIAVAFPGPEVTSPADPGPRRLPDH